MAEFKKVIVPQAIKDLCDFDRRVFHRHPQDLFDPEDWNLFKSYWVVADAQVVGCTVLMHDVDYNEEPRPGLRGVPETVRHLVRLCVSIRISLTSSRRIC